MVCAHRSIDSDLLNRETLDNGYNDKKHIVRFGNYYLDRIDSISSAEVDNFTRKFEIDTGKRAVVVGYNRFKELQHLPAIGSKNSAGVKEDDVCGGSDHRIMVAL